MDDRQVPYGKTAEPTNEQAADHPTPTITRTRWERRRGAVYGGGFFAVIGLLVGWFLAGGFLSDLGHPTTLITSGLGMILGAAFGWVLSMTAKVLAIGIGVLVLGLGGGAYVPPDTFKKV